MRAGNNRGGTIGYEPNSYGQWAEQPGALFRKMTPAQQQVLFENTAGSIGAAPREIQLRHIDHCSKADPAYGAGLRKALGLPG